MKVIQHGTGFVIARKNETQYFSFYVDGTKTSWTKHLFHAAKFQTENSAAAELDHIRTITRQRQK